MSHDCRGSQLSLALCVGARVGYGWERLYQNRVFLISVIDESEDDMVQSMA